MCIRDRPRFSSLLKSTKQFSSFLNHLLQSLLQNCNFSFNHLLLSILFFIKKQAQFFVIKQKTEKLSSHSSSWTRSISHKLHGKSLNSLIVLSFLQSCCNLSFNFRILFNRLAVHLFTPPLGVLTIGIRAYAPDIWFNHLGV